MSHYHHISIDERKCISELYYSGCSIRKIAAQLSRSPSTISRELRRNKSDVGAAVLYHPEAATLAYRQRRQRCVRRYRLSSDIELRRTVQFMLGTLYWSPAQISCRLKEEGKFQIGTSTIYRALETGLLRDTLRFYLRRKYKTIGKAPKKRRKCFENLIKDRPIEADERSELGHSEGDTIIGSMHKSCILRWSTERAGFCSQASVRPKRSRMLRR